MQLNFDAIVIGSGPAGITAAIYLKRANLNVVMIDKSAPGGQLNRITVIENYPGFSTITGPDLAYNMFMQTQELGIPYKYGEVLDITEKGGYKVVKTDKEELTCKVVVIATGRKPRELGLDNEKSLVGKGISWCAICDGTLFKDKEVIVVGGGNSALEESLYLSDIVSKVNIVIRSNEFRGDPILQDRVFKNPKIQKYYNSKITKLNVENDTLSGVEIKNSNTGETDTIKAKGLFIYIGFEPSISYAEDLEVKNNDGYIVVDDSMNTNVDGVYACGDVIKKDLYQITTAISEGSKAAMSAIKYFKENNNK